MAAVHVIADDRISSSLKDVIAKPALVKHLFEIAGWGV